MNTKLSCVTAVMLFSVAAAAAAPAIAAEPAADAAPALTRAEVSAEVLQARANGSLQPAGEGILPFMRMTGAPASRADIGADVLQARVERGLIPAGEGPGAGPTDSVGEWTGASGTVLARNGRH